MREMYKINRDNNNCTLKLKNDKLEFKSSKLKIFKMCNYNEEEQHLYPATLESFSLENDLLFLKKLMIKNYLKKLFLRKNVEVLEEEYVNNDSCYINLYNFLIYDKNNKIILYDINFFINNIELLFKMIDLMKLFERSEEIILEKGYSFITNNTELFENAKIYNMDFPGIFRLGFLNNDKYLAINNLDDLLEYIKTEYDGIISLFIPEYMHMLYSLINKK